MKTINAIGKIDSEGWLTVRAKVPEKTEAGPVEAVIVLQPIQNGNSDVVATARQRKMMECIREIRKLGPIRGMEDPVGWQRSIREDCNIPGEK